MGTRRCAVAQSNVVVVSDGFGRKRCRQLRTTSPAIYRGYRGFASCPIRARQQSIPLQLCFERRDLDRLVFVLPVLLGS